MVDHDHDALPGSEELFPGMPRVRANETALAHGLATVADMLHWRPRHVKSFEAAAQAVGPLSSYPLGLRTVEVRRIVGSVGRAAELGVDFLPIDGHRKMTQRQRRIITAMENGVEMPPIDLYKLKTDYYVLDGNHRVAAARRLGQLYLDAVVTEFVPARDADYTRVFMARQRFERDTGLKGVAATEPEHFRKMWRMIQRYQEHRAAREGARIPIKEAANAWYLSVYAPVTEMIRESKLPRAFPDRRAGDLFVYLADYQERERARGRDLTIEETLAVFRRYYLQRGRRLPSLIKLLHLPSPERGRRQVGRVRTVEAADAAGAAGRGRGSRPPTTTAGVRDDLAAPWSGGASTIFPLAEGVPGAGDEPTLPPSSLL